MYLGGKSKARDSEVNGEKGADGGVSALKSMKAKEEKWGIDQRTYIRCIGQSGEFPPQSTESEEDKENKPRGCTKKKKKKKQTPTHAPTRGSTKPTKVPGPKGGIQRPQKPVISCVPQRRKSAKVNRPPWIPFQRAIGLQRRGSNLFPSEPEITPPLEVLQLYVQRDPNWVRLKRADKR